MLGLCVHYKDAQVLYSTLPPDIKLSCKSGSRGTSHNRFYNKKNCSAPLQDCISAGQNFKAVMSTRQSGLLTHQVL